MSQEKLTYFNPSRVRNVDELCWLSRSNKGNIWIYQPAPGKENEAEELMMQKLICNPKVLNGVVEDYAILRYCGKERLGALLKMLNAHKILLLGVEPVKLGIHLPIHPYEIYMHINMTFLWIDSPDRLSELPAAQKGKVVTLLQKMFQSK